MLKLGLLDGNALMDGLALKISEMCREKPRVSKDIPPVAHDLGRRVVSHLHHHVEMVGAFPFRVVGATTLPPDEISPDDDDFKGERMPSASPGRRGRSGGA